MAGIVESWVGLRFDLRQFSVTPLDKLDFQQKSQTRNVVRCGTDFEGDLMVFTRLHRALVSRAPDVLRIPVHFLPFTLQQTVMGQVLHLVFKDALADGDFDFLQDKWLKISICDLKLAWFISYQNEQLVIAPEAPAVDVSFEAQLNDLILIAGRKEDPDSLFFQRRLRIEGDTELGLEVKNLMDSIDLDVLPALLKRGLTGLASFVHQGLQIPAAHAA
jgi:O2-independent ubiquinone biosynthesis accessory factor UbiT